MLKVMGVNGVSHHVVADDLEGAAAVLQWLSTMPPTLGVPPALLPTSDPVDRSIGYTVSSGESTYSYKLSTPLYPGVDLT